MQGGVVYVYVNPHQLRKYDFMACICSRYILPLRDSLCGWVSLCTTDWLSIVAVENTNLAGTSKAVCHVGAALLGAPLTHCTSQHFSLFTVAHAKPPLIWKKAFGMSLTLSQRETSTFFPPGYRACQKHKRRKLPLCRFRRYCVWFWYSICCLWFLAENWQTSSGFHFPFADCVCVHCERCSWCRRKIRSYEIVWV